jgi:hypothetical protein
MRSLPILALMLAGCPAPTDKDTEPGETAPEDTETGTSGEYGSPMNDAPAAKDHTWSFLLADANIADPANLGSIITAYMSTPIMLTATSIDATSLDMLGGLGVVDSKPHAQDLCLPTFDFAAVSFDANAPSFSTGAVDTNLYVLGTPVPVFDLTIGGTFSADGTSIGEGTLTGIVDTRPIGPLLQGGGGEGAVCEAAKNFGVSCVECPDGAGVFCLNLAADSFVMLEVKGALVPVAKTCE